MTTLVMRFLRLLTVFCTLALLPDDAARAEAGQRVLALLAKCQNPSSTRFFYYDSPENIRSALFDSAPAMSLRRALEESSAGRFTITGDVAGWYDVSLSCATAPNQILYAALDLAAQQGYLRNNYQKVILFAQLPTYSHAVLRGNEIFINATSFDSYSAPIYQARLSTVVHEFGHTLGLDHAPSFLCPASASFPNAACSKLEYGNPLTAMGNGRAALSALERRDLGWLPASAQQTVTSSGRYTLRPLGSASSGLMMLAIPRGEGVPYGEQLILEYRQPLLFDAFLSNLSFFDGAAVSLLEGIIDADTSSPELDPLLPGKSIVDPATGAVVEVVTNERDLGNPEQSRLTVEVRLGKTDLLAPTAAFVSPAQESTVAGVIDLQVAVADSLSGVERVDIFAANGAFLGEALGSGELYGLSIDTTLLPNGTTLFEARASDRSCRGVANCLYPNVAIATRQFTVNNSIIDRTPPAVFISTLTPPNVAEGSGAIFLRSMASDFESSVSTIRIYLDDSPLPAAAFTNDDPHQLSLCGMTLEFLSSEPHTLRASADNFQGSTAWSEPLTISVAADNVHPIVENFSLPDGASFTERSVTLAGTVSDNSGVKRVELVLDGDVVSVEEFTNAQPQSCWDFIEAPIQRSFSKTIDLRAVPDGQHTLGVQVTDYSRNVTEITRTFALVTASTPTSVQFVGEDRTIQGDWHRAFGEEGYALAGDEQNYPADARAAVVGASEYTWVDSTTDLRALERAGGAGRFAATWYGGSFSFDLDSPNGKEQRIAIYSVDWDSPSRVQQFDALDAATGVVLDSRTVRDFSGGVYLVWNVRGHLQLRVTVKEGANAVVSGIFFGEATPPGANPPSTATFLRADTTTRGNWRGMYGSHGYTLAANSSSLPSYVTLGTNATAEYTWSGSTSDGRALQQPAGFDRFAATWYGPALNFNVKMTDGKTHQIAIYCVDWDSPSRIQQFEIVDAATGSVLDSRTISGFSQGHYLVWNLSGNVALRLTSQGGANAVVSGIFID